MSLAALCCRLSPLRAMSLRSSAIARAYTVPRLRRLLQLGAAIGWLQRNSSRSEEGRVVGPRIGWLQRTVAQWLSADSGAASAFQWMLVHDRFQMLSGLSDAPALVNGKVDQPLSTALTMRIWCCTQCGMMNWAQKKKYKKDTNTEHDWRGHQD